MINSIKRFTIPLISFLLIMVISAQGIPPYWSAKITHFLFLLGLFHATARNVASQLMAHNPTISRGQLIVCYLSSWLFAVVIGCRTTVSNYGDVHDPYYGILIVGLVVFNLIFAIAQMDRRDPVNFRRLFAFILKMCLVMVPVILLYFFFGIGFSKDFNSININRFINQLLFMGLLPFLTTLVLPRFTKIKKGRWLTWFGGIPLVMALVFLFFGWIQPTRYKTSQYIAYLEERGLWAEGHIQKNLSLDLTIPERKELVYYTNAMSTMYLPEELAVIQQYYENPYNPSVEAETEFIENFGYSPKSLLINSQPVAESSMEDKRILLKDEARDQILQEQVSETQLIHVDWSDFIYDAETKSRPIQIGNYELFLEESFIANPDLYILTLKDDHGQILTSISPLDLIEARRQIKDEYLPADQLIYPFEGKDLAGYLSVRELVFDPLTLDNYTRLELAIKQDQSSDAFNQITYKDESLKINGQYDAVVSFRPEQFDVQPKDQEVAKKAEEEGNRDLIPMEMHRKLTIDDQDYLLVVRYDYPNSFLRISISQAGQTLVNLPINRSDFHTSMGEVSPESIQFSQGDFEIDFLVTEYFNYSKQTKGYLFIKKYKDS